MLYRAWTAIQNIVRQCFPCLMVQMTQCSQKLTLLIGHVELKRIKQCVQLSLPINVTTQSIDSKRRHTMLQRQRESAWIR